MSEVYVAPEPIAHSLGRHDSRKYVRPLACERIHQHQDRIRAQSNGLEVHTMQY